MAAAAVLHFVAVLFAAGALAPASAHLHGKCSRAVSREVSHMLRKHVYPRVERAGLHLPDECRLHPDHDMYRDQEKHKRVLKKHSWKCDYCGKVFREEVYLDKHMDNRHPDKIQGHVCLGDYAEALHARELRSAELNKAPGETHDACIPAVIRERTLLCQSLFNKCFPPGMAPAADRLHDFFHHSLCEAHTCNQKKKRKLIREIVKRGGIYNWTYAVLSFLIVVAVVIIYAVLITFKVAKGAFSNTPDLQRRPGRQRSGKGWSINSALRAVGAKQKTY